LTKRERRGTIATSGEMRSEKQAVYVIGSSDGRTEKRYFPQRKLLIRVG